MGASHRPRWIALAACVAALCSGQARAATPEGEHAAALESFRRGTTLVERGRLQEAIDAFRDALQHEPSSVGARLDLADCYEKVGAPAAAWREYALAEEHARRANDARRALARSSAAQLEPKLLMVTLTGDAPPSLSVRVDGEALDDELRARPFALAPGSHSLALVAPGKRALSLEVAGNAGEARVVAITLVDDVHPAESKGSTPASGQKGWGIAIGGVGVAGVVVGAITGIIAASKKQTLESEATDPSIGASRFYDDRGTAKTFAAISTAGFLIGGAGAATGAILFFTAPAPGDRQSRVRVRPSLAGVTIDTTF